MASKIYFSPFLPTFNGNGLPVANARLYFFYTGTTNPAPIYSDAGLTILLANPVISNGAARYPNIYLNEAITYRVRETGADGTPLADDIDPYVPGMAYVIVPDLPELADPGGAALVGQADGGTVQDFIDVFSPVAGSIISGNLIIGSLAANLTPGAVAGDHNGDSNTGIGRFIFTTATTAYASWAAGYGALASVTTGNSNTMTGYQCATSLTTGIFNAWYGVDMGELSTNINYSVLIGHHVANGVNATLNAVIMVGDQVGRFLSTGDNILLFGRNVLANTVGAGTHDCLVAGVNSCIKSHVSTSIVLGTDIMQSSGGAGARSVVDGFLGGHRALFGAQTSDNDVVLGVYALFQADNDAMTSSENAVLGSNGGYLLDADRCVLIGSHAAAHAARTARTGIVAIGAHAGDVGSGASALANNDFVLANDYLDAARLIWGNFTTRVVNMGGQLNVDAPIKHKVYTVGTLPAAPGAGSRAGVTDANATVFASVVAAGGANKVPVYFDGTNWIIA